MHQKEELLVKAALALQDPWIRKLLQRAGGVPGRSIVGVVEEVSRALKCERTMAASMRYAALLARDFPATFFGQFIQNDNNESGKKIMSEQQVLTVEHLYSGKRSPFIWGDWPCELTVPEKQQESFKYNFIKDRTLINDGVCALATHTSGFNVRISFPLRRIAELLDPLGRFMKRWSILRVDNVDVYPSLFVSCRAIGKEFDGAAIELNDWIMAKQRRNNDTPEHALASSDTAFFECRFLCGPVRMSDSEFHRLEDEQFRNHLMLACIHHYFGIPTEPCGYAPASKEDAAVNGAEPELVRVTDAQMEALIRIVRETGDVSCRTQGIVCWLLRETKNLTCPVRTQFPVKQNQENALLYNLRAIGSAKINDILQAMGSSLQFSFLSDQVEAGAHSFTMNMYITREGEEGKATMLELES